jgi:hypothetical protein
MNYELKRILKWSRCGLIKVLSWHFLRETTKTSVSIVGVSANIQIERLQSMNLKYYYYANPLCPISPYCKTRVQLWLLNLCTCWSPKSFKYLPTRVFYLLHLFHVFVILSLTSSADGLHTTLSKTKLCGF